MAIVGLYGSQLDFNESVWTIPQENSKNGYEQKVFLIPKLKYLLKRYIENYKGLFREGYLISHKGSIKA